MAKSIQKPIKNDWKTGDGKFATGNGFGRGRPEGSRNKSTLAAEVLLEGESEALARKCIDRALEGDSAALRLCMERIIPTRKSRPVSIELPDIKGPVDILAAMQVVVQSVAHGKISPDDAQGVMTLLELTKRAQEHVDIEMRLAVLEEKMG